MIIKYKGNFNTLIKKKQKLVFTKKFGTHGKT